MVKISPANAGDIETRVQSLGQEDPLEEVLVTHSSIPAWEIPWTEEPGGLYSPWGHKELDKQLSNSTTTATKNNTLSQGHTPIQANIKNIKTDAYEGKENGSE